MANCYDSHEPSPYCSCDYCMRSFEDEFVDEEVYEDMGMEYYYSSKPIRDISYCSPTPFIKQQDNDSFKQKNSVQSTVQKFATTEKESTIQRLKNLKESTAAHGERFIVQNERINQQFREIIGMLTRLCNERGIKTSRTDHHHVESAGPSLIHVRRDHMHNSRPPVEDEKGTVVDVSKIGNTTKQNLDLDGMMNIERQKSKSTCFKAMGNPCILLEEGEMFSMLGKSEFRLENAHHVFDIMLIRGIENAGHKVSVVMGKALKVFENMTEKEGGHRESFVYDFLAHVVEHTYKVLLIHIMDQMYDVLLLHGGATGCGVALDAVTRGICVRLVEQVHEVLLVWVCVAEQTQIGQRQMLLTLYGKKGNGKIIAFVVGLRREYHVDIKGVVLVSDIKLKGTSQKVEIQVMEIFSISKVVHTTKREIEIEDGLNVNVQLVCVNQDNTFLNYRVDTRTLANQLICCLQCQVENIIRPILIKEGFVGIHTTKLTGGTSKGGPAVFKLDDYKGQLACLVQSPALNVYDLSNMKETR